MISEREVAKTLTRIEKDPLEAKDIVSKYPERDYLVVGITGSPGSGKSTMTDRLAEMFAIEKDVAIIAVDPTSAFTGGAFLGDRIRMRHSAKRKNIFIRSMASRGAVGGLSPGIYDAVEFLGRVGYDIIFVETVGVGQSETDIVNLADLVLLVLAPGSGDDVQMLKAGIMEIGDIYVVNKKDLDGSGRLLANIEATLKLVGIERDVLSTNSITGENLDELKEVIRSHLDVLIQTEKFKENRKDRYRFNLLNTLFSILRTRYKRTEDLEKIIDMYSDEEGKEMKAEKIDHIGIAVKSIEEHKKIYIDYLGFELEKIETLDDRGLKVAFLNAGNTKIELLESFNPDSTIAKHIEKRGEGIHHIAISVDSVLEGIEKAKKMNLKPLSETPREGAGGTNTVFLHPKSTKGVLIELVEGEH